MVWGFASHAQSRYFDERYIYTQANQSAIDPIRVHLVGRHAIQFY